MDVDIALESREIEFIPINIQFVLEHSKIKVKIFMFHLQDYIPPLEVYSPSCFRYLHDLTSGFTVSIYVN